MEILLDIDKCKNRIDLDEFTITESEKKEIIKDIDLASNIKSVEYVNIGADADRSVAYV